MNIQISASTAVMIVALMFGLDALARDDPRRGPAGCVPVAERKSERGCYLLASDNLGKMRSESLYWHLAAFPTRELAEKSKEPNSTVVEALGIVWKFMVGSEDWRAPLPGNHVATLGPFNVDPQLEYTATYMEAIMLPGATTMIHRHAGPEIIHVLQGEECMETPDGKQVGRPGGKPVIVAANVPHKLTAIGTAERRALALVLHDSREVWVNRAHDHGWQEKGLCK